MEQTQILIVGAGPAGSVAAAMLRQQGFAVLMIEREKFPRFSIGESLLPQSMQFLEKAGLLRDVVEEGFQHKNGAAFARGEQRTNFDFRDRFSEGWGTTYQVERGRFDQILASGAEKAGAQVRFGHQVTAMRPGERPEVDVLDENGQPYTVAADFVLDASGFGRLLPRLLNLESPSNFPVRSAIFTHVMDRITDADFDRNKILITTHPKHNDVWFWTIPFSGGRCSLGVVATAEYLAQFEGSPEEVLKQCVAETPSLSGVLREAAWGVMPVRQITGYSANVSSLHGPGFALLGNAGEFLDPVFSSGVTIAFKSADLATQCLVRARDGETVNWETEFAEPLRYGVKAFRAIVESWYEGGFQDVIYYSESQPDVRRMICSILAGYAWDSDNPYVREPARRLKVLEQICADEG